MKDDWVARIAWGGLEARLSTSPALKETQTGLQTYIYVYLKIEILDNTYQMLTVYQTLLEVPHLIVYFKPHDNPVR